MQAVLALVLLAQHDQTAPRVEKSQYLSAVARCKEGEALIDSEPKEAILRFDAVIADARVHRLIESRLRIEEKVSEYTDRYFFLPYQYRGRATVKLAAKSEREAAEKLLAGAIEDFQESVKKGVAGTTLQKGVLSSEDMLKAAKDEVQRLKASAATVKPPDPPKDPEPEFRTPFFEMLSQRRFRDAREHVDKAGAFLNEAKRKEYVARAEAECHRHVGEVLQKFADNLARTPAVGIARLSSQELEATFPLPKEAEVCVKLDALDWATAFRPVLDRLRRREEALDLLFQAAAGAAPLEAKDGLPWFRGTSDLIHQLLEPKVRQCVQSSKSAPAEERAKLHSQAVALKQRWSGLANGIPKELRDRAGYLGDRVRAFDDLISQFPISSDDIRKAGPDLEKSFEADQPDAELERIATGLTKVQSELGERLTVESRQELLTYLLVASALRQLLEAKDVEAVAGMQDLKKVGADLKAAGGPVDVKRFGSKVVRVLASLTK